MAGGITVRTPTTNTAAAATSMALNVPAGTQAGEMMLAYICTDSTQPITTFTGWTQINAQLWNSSVLFSGVVFKRVATASEPASYTASNAGASNWVGIMITLTGPDTSKGGTGGQDVFATAGVGFGAGSSCTTGSMTTTQDGDYVLNFIGTQKAGAQIATFTPPAGYVDIQTLVGSTMSIEISAQPQLAKGATGVQTTNFSAAAVTGAATGLSVFARHIPIGGRPSLPHVLRAWEPPPPYVIPRYERVTEATAANIFNAPTLTATALLNPPTLRIDGTTSPTGLAATAALGTPMVWNIQAAIAHAQVGTVTITNDMIFALPTGLVILHPAQGLVNTFGMGLSIGASATAAGLQATAQLGSVVYQSSVGVSGLAAAAALGTFTTRVAVSLSPAGLAAVAALGSPTYQSAYAITGVAGAGQLGNAIVLNNNIFPELGVAGGAAVGTVGFTVTGSSNPAGVAASGQVGVCGFAFDNRAAVTGVAASGAVGGSSGYGSITGVQATGQVGTALAQTNVSTSPTGLHGIAQVGTVTLAFDNRATVTGVAATGQVGVVDFVSFTPARVYESLYVRTVSDDVWLIQ